MYFRILLVSLFLYSGSLSAQFSITKFKAIDGQEITKDQFQQQVRSHSYFWFYTDDMTAKQLTDERTGHGRVVYKKYIEQLNAALALNIDARRPLILVFYPGNDPCNQSGTATSGSLKIWYRKLAKKANKITPINNILFVYKNRDGLKSAAVLDWHKDVDQFVENSFFPRHHPCGSVAVLSPTNRYITIFGEFTKEMVLKVLKRLQLKE